MHEDIFENVYHAAEACFHEPWNSPWGCQWKDPNDNSEFEEAKQTEPQGQEVQTLDGTYWIWLPKQ